MSAKAATKVVKQLAGSGTGQSLMDRVTQAKFSLAGSGLGKVVAKATTEEIGAPKKKHLDYLITCSNEPNVSIPLLAGLLVERMQEKSWVIVFKALITTHNLMNFGNEKFSYYLASNCTPVNLPNFNDKSSAQAYEMSLFIRNYSRYISEKTASYRAIAFDFCKVKRGRDDGVLRTMPVDKLLKALPVLSEQLSVLLQFDAHEKDLNNAIINAAFLLMYKDLIRLFASYNEGMINLIEKYFTLKRKECRLGLDLYHAFPDLLAKVTEFLALAESMGIGDKESLGLQPVPAKVIQAMEQHLSILESKATSDDEDGSVDNRSAGRRTPVKKPALPVPLPNTKPASPQKPPIPRSPEHRIQTLHESARSHSPETVTEEQPINADEPIPESDVVAEEAENAVTCPTLLVSDEDGLPSALQEEIIAAATSHLSESIAISNEAVKRSVHHTSITTNPIHTQMGRLEQRTVSVRSSSPVRSRSPSPARPSTPPHLPHRDEDRVFSASDNELHESAEEGPRRNLSLLGLNERAGGSGRASPICGSPFACDERVAEPASDVPSWPEETDDTDQTTFNAAFDAGAPAVAFTTTDAAPATVAPTESSALDSLFGLDFLSSEDTQTATITPIPLQPMSSQSVQFQATTQVAETAVKSSGVELEDLLSLDPLLCGADKDTVPEPLPHTNTPISILPAGLKPVQSTVPIRPAAVHIDQSCFQFGSSKWLGIQRAKKAPASRFFLIHSIRWPKEFK
ncbi:unnamed protein product [Dicrocoelium dendriticum]|nr:unnamed protein product [Dicrocoelium dendriticum]